MIKNNLKNKILSTIIAVTMLFSVTACSSGDGSDKVSPASESSSSLASESASSASESSSSGSSDDAEKYKGMDASQICAALTLDQKAAQMVLPSITNVNEDQMEDYCYGGVLSKYTSVDYKTWQLIVDEFQKYALKSDASIPIIYGQDDVHGVNYATGTVIFPHNIGMGAADDEELMYKVGQITADEAKLCHMIWNYAPVIAQSVDPRWGRTYESYGSNLDRIKRLSVAYTKGLLDSGMIVCPKHFFADGNVAYGSGENDDIEMLMDRGNAELSDEEIKKLLSVYQAQIDAGAQTIMISHSSLNGTKMHENAKYIQYLKNEMGFKGFIVSDWDSVKHTSPDTYKEQMITCVNAGIDMFMEVGTFEEARKIIVKAVESGDISEERVNDAVERIIKVKLEAGVFDDPYFKNMKTVKSETGSEEYRAVARECVEKSQVLIKNNNNLLPLKSGTKLYITGPAADNPAAQCGGWTIDWNSADTDDIEGLTTIYEAFKENAEEYGITLVDSAKEADIILLAVGEESYAEWNGDTEDLELCGELGLAGNKKAIEKAADSKKPVVCCIVAGRNVIIKDYVDKWDAVVMSYLPGSEGKGVSNVICGKAKFTGKLPSPWYSDLSQIGTGECWLEEGYGLTTE